MKLHIELTAYKFQPGAVVMRATVLNAPRYTSIARIYRPRLCDPSPPLDMQVVNDFEDFARVELARRIVMDAVYHSC